MPTETARGMDSFSIEDAALRMGRQMSRQMSKESARSKESFLNPTGPSPDVPAPGVGKWTEIGFFVFFVLSRAIHPTIIDESKTLDPTIDDQRKIRYSSVSLLIVQNVLIVVGMQLVALLDGGMEQWRSIWKNKRAWEVFAALGVVLAIGDWLEMLSMGGLSGSVYQILLQSKFVVTAVMMMYVKGAMQSRLQWLLLICLMSTMSLYMSFAPSSSGSSSSAASASIPWFGMTMAFIKVIVSCLAAVMSDKYMKDLNDLPIHVQLVQMTIPRLLFTFLILFTEEDAEGQGLFRNWNWLVVGVEVSFIVKSVGTLYLLAYLDALLKNIGEALAVLLIYAWEIGPQVICMTSPASTHCEMQDAFDVPRLIAVTTVVMIVIAYLETKALIEKAKQYDASLKAAQKPHDMP